MCAWMFCSGWFWSATQPSWKRWFELHQIVLRSQKTHENFASWQQIQVPSSAATITKYYKHDLSGTEMLFPGIQSVEGGQDRAGQAYDGVKLDPKQVVLRKTLSFLRKSDDLGCCSKIRQNRNTLNSGLGFDMLWLRKKICGLTRCHFGSRGLTGWCHNWGVFAWQFASLTSVDYILIWGSQARCIDAATMLYDVVCNVWMSFWCWLHIWQGYLDMCRCRFCLRGDWWFFGRPAARVGERVWMVQTWLRVIFAPKKQARVNRNRNLMNKVWESRIFLSSARAFLHFWSQHWAWELCASCHVQWEMWRGPNLEARERPTPRRADQAPADNRKRTWHNHDITMT